jgi:hypothetical protein
LQVEKEYLLEGNIDSFMRRGVGEDGDRKERSSRAAEARSTYEECGEYGHVQKIASKKPRWSIT